MANNDTIKALEELLETMLYEGDLQRSATISKALDLVNRQEVEIKELEKEINHYKINLPYLEHQGEDFCGVPCSFIENLVEQAKAIKEFAEGLERRGEKL